MKNITVQSAGVDYDVDVQPTTMVKDILSFLHLTNNTLARQPKGAPAFGDADVIFNDVKAGDKLYAIPTPTPATPRKTAKPAPEEQPA